METLKAGTILVNRDLKQVYLIYRKNLNDYSFPKGHLEKGETLEECAYRETLEETEHENRIIKKIKDISYVSSINENSICSYYLAEDLEKTTKEINPVDKETYFLVDIDKVEELLTYDNLKELWNEAKEEIIKEFDF